MSILSNKSRPSILIVLIAGIGDLILASKSIRAIRNGYPDAEIHLLTSTDAAPLATNYQYIDHVHAFPIRALRKDKKYLFDIFRLIRKLGKIRFDLALNLYMVGSLSGAMKMGLLYFCLCAKERIGHDAHGFGFFLTGKAPQDIFKNRHFTDSMMDLTLMAGGISDDQGIEVFWDRLIVEKWVSLLNNDQNTEQALKIGINPGGDRENRRWRPKNYAEVADRIMDLFPSSVFLLGGPGEEDIARKIEMTMKHPAVNLAGKLSLNELTYLISRFNLQITNDSGPMHIAAATKTPLVALFGPEDPRLFGPYTTSDIYRVIHKDVPCRPCGETKCTGPLCLELITPEEVLKACIEVLQVKS